MTTFGGLKTAVATWDLQDPGGKTFALTEVGDMINAGLTEIGRIAPLRFEEDILPIANAASYTLRSAVFAGAAIPEIEVSRVEIWDASVVPGQPISRIQPYDAEYLTYSETGWKVWDGVLWLPHWVPIFLVGHEANYLIKVWGYSPYVGLVSDTDVVPLSAERERALRLYCRMEGLERLVYQRDLFTQWQTRSGNTDVSPAALMSGLNSATERWRRYARSIAVLREAP